MSCHWCSLYPVPTNPKAFHLHCPHRPHGIGSALSHKPQAIGSTLSQQTQNPCLYSISRNPKALAVPQPQSSTPSTLFQKNLRYWFYSVPQTPEALALTYPVPTELLFVSQWLLKKVTTLCMPRNKVDSEATVLIETCYQVHQDHKPLTIPETKSSRQTISNLKCLLLSLNNLGAYIHSHGCATDDV